MSSREPRRIVITGVSRGLGRALVDAFADAGHVVAGCAQSQTAIDEQRKRWPAPHHFHQVDVTDDRQVAEWADSVFATGGPPDLLVNNAGVINRNANLWQLTAEEADHVVDVNVKGVMNVIRHFLPSMIERGRGVVVNFSSGWGRSVAPQVAPYCASKWAIEGLTLALAEELPAGMAAVPVNPGVVNTDMLQSCFGEHASSYLSPEEWAATASSFLLHLDATDNGRSLTV